MEKSYANQYTQDMIIKKKNAFSREVPKNVKIYAQLKVV